MKLTWFLLGLIVGVIIGYVGQNIISGYVKPYTFSTSLYLTMQDENMTVTVNSLITLKAVLSAEIPADLKSVPDFEKYILQDKDVTLFMKFNNSFYWSLISTRKTVYIINAEATFNYIPENSGVYVFKAVFNGSPLLKECSSNELVVNVV